MTSTRRMCPSLATFRPSAPGLARAGLAACLAFAALVPVARAEVATEVRVERAKPERPKAATLQFLRENIDFIRSRFDGLRERPVEIVGEASAVDPRFLAYRDMLVAITAAKDSTDAASDRDRRRTLLASVTQLGDLERQLDLMERLLAEQRDRLGRLQDDFAGDPRTSLIVLASGYPGSAALSRVAITLEGGDTLSVPLGATQREALRRGGVVEIFHGLIEPRQQTIAVTLAGDRWPSGDSGYVTLDPARDRITVLRLDLSTVEPAQGAIGIHASTWLHDARTPSRDG